MRPQQLVAAGYSEYDPVSKTRKQDNRRIEIALLPSIDELPQFPEDPAAGPAAEDKGAVPGATPGQGARGRGAQGADAPGARDSAN